MELHQKEIQIYVKKSIFEYFSNYITEDLFEQF
jgi:hypothetical protein